MELIQTNKGGFKLCHENYLYTKKFSSNSSTCIFWVCSKRRLECGGSARTNIGLTT